ncbi:hypothetical protein BJ165DRAFT_1599173 [Panaeolus papilionaceus]|nr:hypothetical protein BJ165DRAFT_1599173 [Panaeolus papilionaceus]
MKPLFEDQVWRVKSETVRPPAEDSLPDLTKLLNRGLKGAFQILEKSNDPESKYMRQQLGLSPMEKSNNKINTSYESRLCALMTARHIVDVSMAIEGKWTNECQGEERKRTENLPALTRASLTWSTKLKGWPDTIRKRLKSMESANKVTIDQGSNNNSVDDKGMQYHFNNLKYLCDLAKDMKHLVTIQIAIMHLAFLLTHDFAKDGEIPDWHDSLDEHWEGLHHVNHWVTTSAKEIRQPLQMAGYISPLVVIMGQGKFNKNDIWPKAALMEYSRCLGNAKPAILIEVEKVLWGFLFQAAMAKVPLIKGYTDALEKCVGLLDACEEEIDSGWLVLSLENTETKTPFAVQKATARTIGSDVPSAWNIVLESGRKMDDIPDILNRLEEELEALFDDKFWSRVLDQVFPEPDVFDERVLQALRREHLVDGGGGENKGDDRKRKRNQHGAESSSTESRSQTESQKKEEGKGGKVNKKNRISAADGNAVNSYKSAEFITDSDGYLSGNGSKDKGKSREAEMDDSYDGDGGGQGPGNVKDWGQGLTVEDLGGDYEMRAEEESFEVQREERRVGAPEERNDRDEETRVANVNENKGGLKRLIVIQRFSEYSSRSISKHINVFMAEHKIARDSSIQIHRPIYKYGALAIESSMSLFPEKVRFDKVVMKDLDGKSKSFDFRYVKASNTQQNDKTLKSIRAWIAASKGSLEKHIVDADYTKLSDTNWLLKKLAKNHIVFRNVPVGSKGLTLDVLEDILDPLQPMPIYGIFTFILCPTTPLATYIPNCHERLTRKMALDHSCNIDVHDRTATLYTLLQESTKDNGRIASTKQIPQVFNTIDNPVFSTSFSAWNATRQSPISSLDQPLPISQQNWARLSLSGADDTLSIPGNGSCVYIQVVTGTQLLFLLTPMGRSGTSSLLAHLDEQSSPPSSGWIIESVLLEPGFAIAFTLDHCLVQGYDFYCTSTLKNTAIGLAIWCKLDGVAIKNASKASRILTLVLEQQLTIQAERAHIPILSTSDGIANLLTACMLGILLILFDENAHTISSVVGDEEARRRLIKKFAYCNLTTTERDQYAYVRGVSMELVDWLVTHWIVTAPNDAAEVKADVIYGRMGDWMARVTFYSPENKMIRPIGAFSSHRDIFARWMQNLFSHRNDSAVHVWSGYKTKCTDLRFKEGHGNLDLEPFGGIWKAVKRRHPLAFTISDNVNLFERGCSHEESLYENGVKSWFK